MNDVKYRSYVVPKGRTLIKLLLLLSMSGKVKVETTFVLKLKSGKSIAEGKVCRENVREPTSGMFRIRLGIFYNKNLQQTVYSTVLHYILMLHVKCYIKKKWD